VTALPRFFGRRGVPVVLQAEAAECGLACLAMVAGAHGHATDTGQLRQRFSVSGRGTSLARLMDCAGQLELLPRAVRAEPGELGTLALPAILHWNLDHFVVLERIGPMSAVVVDPALGRRRISLESFGRHFTGVALELLPTPAFRPQRDGRPLRLRELASGLPGLGRALGLLLLLSVALQAVALAMPFYGQLVIDDVVQRGDRELLLVLALAAGLLVLLQVVVGMCRAWLVVALATRLNLLWSARVFGHLVRLPQAWFDRRHAGDVQSRFASLASLQRLLTRQFVEAVMDGLMAVTTVAIMLRYDVTLALVVLAAVLLYAAVRAALAGVQYRASLEGLAAAARRDGVFLETLRGMLAVKTCGLERHREQLFTERQAEAGLAAAAAGRLGVWQSGASRALAGLQLVVVVAAGAVAVLDGRLSVGMLVAFLGYRAMFTERAAGLVDRLFEFRLARAELERLADILRSDCEPPDRAVRRRPASRQLGIGCRRIAYRHAADEPWLVRDFSLAVGPGEHVVITGPSGRGKTTLLKLLMGLLEPGRGTVLVDGLPLARYGLFAYRRLAAGVMQNDRLFSGTVADNLSGFAPRPDLGRCRACARLARVDDTIEALPMGYLTPVGDMGALFSGGEGQRLLLARALYRRPAVLFLDEFTSHVDPACEARILEGLATLPLTLVAVAHRRESVRRADREIALPALAEDLP